jgi:protein O-GlcNAc transferase
MSQSLYQSAVEFYQAGALEKASAALHTILQNNPNQADSLHLLGIIYYQSGQSKQAVNAIKQAITLQPRNINFLNNYGLCLKANQQFDEALSAYQQALQLNPKDLDVQLNIANLMMQQSRFEEAAGYYRRLMRIYKQYDPKQQEVRSALCHALQLLGNQSHQMGQFIQAEASFAEAIQYHQKDSSLYYNLANAERELGKTKSAFQHYQTAITLNPNDADAYNNLGNVQRELGLLDEAIASYQQALLLNPKLYHAQVHLVHQKQHVCDWEGLTDAISIVREYVEQYPQAQVSPFAFLAMPGTTRQAQLSCANHWVNNRFQVLKKTTFEVRKQASQAKKSKLSIGYLSADFRLHPLAFLITDLIEQHDRTKFEVIAYSFGVDDQSIARKRLINAFDQFHEIRTLSEMDAAKKIHADGIDILIDLTGFTQTSRSGIMALRPASIHLSWLGFPGTMGFLDKETKQPLFDYLLTDEYISPPEHAFDYAEKLAYLPCYQPNDRQRPIGDVPSRQACHLPNDQFIFCSFNQSFKITPAIFEAWMRILNAIPTSVLWLLACNPTAQKNLMQQARKNGINPDRLIFAPRVSIDQHLARHAHADLFLDTQPYNAHTTCSDALWMDVPVLTIEGDTFASRVAGSLLTALNLSDLICPTLAEYESKAVYYASNPAELEKIKQQLIKNKTNSFLFDTPTFTKALEASFVDMWENKA